MKLTYRHTITACFIGYIVQAIIVNFAPLLFVTFQSSYGISLSRITLLITVNFVTQLLTDFASVSFVDRIGYRTSVIIAHICSAAGLISMSILPDVMPDPFAGLIVSMILCGMGGGLIEVLISPMVEACPSDNKESAMSLLHSFYCWGQMGVVLLSTIFFALFGTAQWRILACLWAVIPLCNIALFARVPIASVVSEGERGMTVTELAREKVFWVLLLLMMCAGASELAVAQWASTFAERGLGVSKTIGDLTGPMLFAITMGITRVFYGKCGNRINLSRFMAGSGFLCILAYLIISLSPWSALGLAGCALCGFAVGILWPGALSIAAATLRRGGTALFALLALAGDMGCSVGPTFVGLVAGAAGDNLQAGILAALVFPLLMLAGIVMKGKLSKKEDA